MPDTIARAVFGLLFETSTDAAFILDRDRGRVLSANVRTAELLARDHSGLLGLSLTELVFESDRDLSQPGRYEGVRLRRADDSPLDVELQVAHVDSAEYGRLTACMARDMTERRALERELLARQRELETRNAQIALLAWRAAMGELVAGIAHHLNNPVGALTSTILRLVVLVGKLPLEHRAELERLFTRVSQISRRIESNVAAILQASHGNVLDETQGRPELPPELARVLSTFAERLNDIPTKELA